MVDGVMRERLGDYVEERPPTLRDMIASQAVVGILTGGFHTPNRVAEIASSAYAIADAMMAERRKYAGK